MTRVHKYEVVLCMSSVHGPSHWGVSCIRQVWSRISPTLSDPALPYEVTRVLNPGTRSPNATPVPPAHPSLPTFQACLPSQPCDRSCLVHFQIVQPPYGSLSVSFQRVLSSDRAPQACCLSSRFTGAVSKQKTTSATSKAASSIPSTCPYLQ
jgi:hypothetical protein